MGRRTTSAAWAAALGVLLSSCTPVEPAAVSAFVPWELEGEQVIALEGTAAQFTAIDSRMLLRAASAHGAEEVDAQTWYEGSRTAGTADAAAALTPLSLPTGTVVVIPREPDGTYRLVDVGRLAEPTGGDRSFPLENGTALVEAPPSGPTRELDRLDGEAIGAGILDGRPAWALGDVVSAKNGGPLGRFHTTVQVLTDDGPVTLNSPSVPNGPVAEPPRPVEGMPADQLQPVSGGPVAFDPNSRTWALAVPGHVAVIEDGSVTNVLDTVEGALVSDLAVCGADLYAVLEPEDDLAAPLPEADPEVLDRLTDGTSAGTMSVQLDGRPGRGPTPLAPHSTHVGCTSAAVLSVVQGDEAFAVVRAERDTAD